MRSIRLGLLVAVVLALALMVSAADRGVGTTAAPASMAWSAGAPSNVAAAVVFWQQGPPPGHGGGGGRDRGGRGQYHGAEMSPTAMVIAAAFALSVVGFFVFRKYQKRA